MIIAVGTDVVSLQRIASAMEKPEFIDRILSANEQQRTITVEYLAGRWASKEAIKKCLPYLNKWHQVEVINNVGSAPEVTIHHPEFDPEHHKIHLSISHERDIAIAFAVLEKFS